MLWRFIHLWRFSLSASFIYFFPLFKMSVHFYSGISFPQKSTHLLPKCTLLTHTPSYMSSHTHTFAGSWGVWRRMTWKAHSGSRGINFSYIICLLPHEERLGWQWNNKQDIVVRSLLLWFLMPPADPYIKMTEAAVWYSAHAQWRKAVAHTAEKMTYSKALAVYLFQISQSKCIFKQTHLIWRVAQSGQLRPVRSETVDKCRLNTYIIKAGFPSQTTECVEQVQEELNRITATVKYHFKMEHRLKRIRRFSSGFNQENLILVPVSPG